MKPKLTNKLEKAEVLKTITRLYIQGYYQSDIAKQVNISQQQVSRYINKIINEWKNSDLININEHKKKELEKLNVIESEAWQAWHNSTKEKLTKIARNKNEVTEKTVKSEDNYGNSIFLKIVLDCIDKRCKILGLNAPVQASAKLKAEITGPDNTIKEMTKDQLEKFILELDND